MKGTLDRLTPESASFTMTANTDVKIKGVFTGLVWLESQTPGETTWERVPDSLFKTEAQYGIAVNDATIAYRFNSSIESGEAVVYAGGVTQVNQDVLFNAEDTSFGGDTIVTY